jgi:hypothetical protein
MSEFLTPSSTPTVGSLVGRSMRKSSHDRERRGFSVLWDSDSYREYRRLSIEFMGLETGGSAPG